MAQAPEEGPARIEQIGSASAPILRHSLLEPQTDDDQIANDLWSQLHCSGLGAPEPECALVSSGRVPPPAGGNSAQIVQRGSFNVARILQQGMANVVHASQDGVGNALDAEQIGEGNRIAARLVGDDGTLRMSQRGDGNAYLFSFEGDGIDHVLSQVGTGLRAVQIGTGGMPFSIEQRGTDMEIRIVHDPLSGWPR